ncbi:MULTISPECIES: hypothetical protein [Mesorhizobium]|uniref:hypothetical protein n=1 Tax=Mesorhizobium TaxID=68287 RepID=UPI0010133D30|nr:MULTISPECIES: hypothetical protein [Mesorhizobium]
MGQRRVEFVSKLISNALFAVGVAAVVLVLLGGTTWLSGGFWGSDGAYSRSISPVICIAWLLVVSWVLVKRSPATRVVKQALPQISCLRSSNSRNPTSRRSLCPLVDNFAMPIFSRSVGN